MTYMPQKAMSSKQKRLMEAARLRYMEELSNQQIADRLGVTEGTVRNYFSQEDMSQFKRFYSDQEIFQLQQSLEQDIKDGEDLANNLLARAIQHEDTKPSTYVRASKEALENRKRKVDLLQELGIIEKKPDKIKEEEAGVSEVNINMDLVENEEEEEEAEVEG